jgi:hypothetical protein
MTETVFMANMTRMRLPEHHPSVPKPAELAQELDDLQHEYDCQHIMIGPMWTQYWHQTLRQIGWEVNCTHRSVRERFDGTEEFCLNCPFYDPPLPA